MTRQPWPNASRTLASALIACYLATSSPALAQPSPPDPKRSVAVLEFRGGSAAMPNIGKEAAELLRTKTSLQIVDIDEARQRFGARLDRKVADCGADEQCLSALGKRLRVREVLLIGVSEFGDIILTLQRFDVNEGEVVGRVAEALAPDTVPTTETILGYLQRVMPEADFVRYGTIRIDANVTGATVKVDTIDRGKTPVEPLRVPAPASYRINVDKVGYLGFEASVEVPPEAVVRVRPFLVEQRDPIYSKWYFWGSVAAGTALAVTAIVLGVRSSGDPDDPEIVIPPFE